MELVSSSRSILSSCNRLAAAPSRTAYAAAKRSGKRVLVCVLSSERGGYNGDRKGVVEGRISRRAALALLLATPALSVAFSAHGKTKGMNPYDERRLLEQNKKIQEANRAPDDFPNFIREGFQVKVVTPENYITRDSGLIYEDVKIGTGDCPKDGQQVIFHYVGYNESGRRIDSTYIQGSPAKIRLGNKSLVPGKYSLVTYSILVLWSTGYSSIFNMNFETQSFCVFTGKKVFNSNEISICGWGCKTILALITPMNFLGHNAVISQLISGIYNAGFEEGIRDMKPGGKRRLIIPPELGPPVGPSTFFSAKQFEVFDVELLSVQDCQRRTIAFYSDVICS